MERKNQALSGWGQPKRMPKGYRRTGWRCRDALDLGKLCWDALLQPEHGSWELCLSSAVHLTGGMFSKRYRCKVSSLGQKGGERSGNEFGACLLDTFSACHSSLEEDCFFISIYFIVYIISNTNPACLLSSALGWRKSCESTTCKQTDTIAGRALGGTASPAMLSAASPRSLQFPLLAGRGEANEEHGVDGFWQLLGCVCPSIRTWGPKQPICWVPSGGGPIPLILVVFL